MAFTGNFMCTSFKDELLEGVHDFRLSTGDVFKLALYTNSASFTAATTAYTATNEVGNSGTYSAGGGTLTNVSPAVSVVFALAAVAVPLGNNLALLMLWIAPGTVLGWDSAPVAAR